MWEHRRKRGITRLSSWRFHGQKEWKSALLWYVYTNREWITPRSLFFACHAFSDLEEGKTYQFDNLVVRREYNTKDIILAKPKTGCKAVETASFKENVIQPFELLKSLTTTTTPTEILGVQSFPAYHSCCQCKKKIILEKSTVITCNICGVKQKVRSTT